MAKTTTEKIEARERLQAVAHALGLKMTQFQRIAGLSGSYGRNFTGAMNDDKARFLSGVMPFVNIDYINDGIGEMFLYQPTEEELARLKPTGKRKMTVSYHNVKNSNNQVGNDMIIGGTSETEKLYKARIAALENEVKFLRDQNQTLLSLLKKN